jgi:hypothetical protein
MFAASQLSDVMDWRRSVASRRPALPDCAVLLTSNALAVGTVFALAGVPRGLFILLRGGLTGHLTPRKLMIGSNLVRMVF